MLLILFRRRVGAVTLRPGSEYRQPRGDRSESAGGRVGGQPLDHVAAGPFDRGLPLPIVEAGVHLGPRVGEDHVAGADDERPEPLGLDDLHGAGLTR